MTQGRQGWQSCATLHAWYFLALQESTHPCLTHPAPQEVHGTAGCAGVLQHGYRRCVLAPAGFGCPHPHPPAPSSIVCLTSAESNMR